MAKKKQGDNARLDESMGARNGKKKQSLASRRKESEGTEKSMGRRKYSAVSTMDKGNRKRVVNLGAGGPVGRTASSASSSNTPQHKLMAMGKSVPQGKAPVKMRGGGLAAVKKMNRGGPPGRRTAADSAKAKTAHGRSSHKYFSGASQNPKRRGRNI